MRHAVQKKIIDILLADDDKDDRYFFGLALQELTYISRLTTVIDGEMLMKYLLDNTDHLPDVLFLDLNMPRKNGAECLMEIKKHPKLKELPVIIYSTSVHEDMATLLYEYGAFYYVLKRDFTELMETLEYLFTIITKPKMQRPERDKFILALVA